MDCSNMGPISANQIANLQTNFDEQIDVIDMRQRQANFGEQKSFTLFLTNSKIRDMARIGTMPVNIPFFQTGFGPKYCQ